MEPRDTSSLDSDLNEFTNYKHEDNFQAEVSKFYATIATISRNMRKDNWTYLQRHPEIRAIIRVITNEAIKAKASNIPQFTADLFKADNEKELIEKINKQLKAVNEQTRGDTPDGNMTFPDSTDNSSEGNDECPPTNFAAPQNTDEFVKPVGPENFKPSCK